jgi:hypothetical protein
MLLLKIDFFLSGKSSHPSKQKPQPNQDLTKKRNKQKNNKRFYTIVPTRENSLLFQPLLMNLN